MGKAQRDVSRKKERGDGVGDESEGTPVIPLTKARSGIPYDWSILTALASNRIFITLIGNVMR